MKKFFIICFTVVAMLCNSCGEAPVRSCGDDTNLVYRNTKEGRMYGARCDGKITIPLIYSAYSKGITPTSYFFIRNNNYQELFLLDVEGFDVLSNRWFEDGTLSFEPVAIKTPAGYYKVKDDYRYYFGDIFCRGKYFLFPTVDGQVYAAFVNNAVSTFGPFKRFFPGCSGYMYQDKSTGKWGAFGAQMVDYKSGYLCWTLNERELFAPDNDEIIEVVVGDVNRPTPIPGEQVGWKRYIWFARQGNLWKSYLLDLNAEGFSEVNAIEVNQRLLAYVLKMMIKPIPLRQSGINTKGLATDQRFGTAETSVVVL